MSDSRNNLHQQLCMMLMTRDINIEDIALEMHIILDQYEIQERCTEVTLLSENRNEELLKRFVVAKTVKGCTERTIGYYSKELTKILLNIGKTADDITADDIRLYLALRQRRDKVAKATADNELRCLRSFFAYLMTEEIITKNPVLRIDSIKYNKPRKQAFTELEVEQIRDCLSSNRERAIVEVLLSTGCRVTELVNIKISELEEDKVIVHGKGEKDRTCYLNAKAQVAIGNYLVERKDTNPYLFCGGYYGKFKGKTKEKKSEWYKDATMVHKENPVDKGTIEQFARRVSKRSGVESVYPHKFRRTCATFALRRGMPIEKVSAMLGHESITTTQIYISLTEEELEQAHRKYVS